MSTTSSQARALVSALINVRPNVIARAAAEAAWQQKQGKISRASLDEALGALKALGWEGQAPPVQLEFAEKEYVISYLCRDCGRGVRDIATYGPETAIRIELERRARSRLKLHSDFEVSGGCMGILQPVGLSLK